MFAVWIGALLGCGISLIIGIIFIIIFYVAQNAVFSGDGKVIFQGFLMLLASWLITILGFAMLKINGYEAKWESKLQRQAAAQAAARTDERVSCTLATPLQSESCQLCHVCVSYMCLTLHRQLQLLMSQLVLCTNVTTTHSKLKCYKLCTAMLHQMLHGYITVLTRTDW